MVKKIDALIILFFLATFAYMIVSLLKIITTTAPDFPVYYFSTLDFVVGKNAYIDGNLPTMFIYPVITSLLYLPFLMFSYEISQGIFVILSVLAVPSIVYISLKIIYKHFSWRHIFIFTSLAYLSFPTKFTLGMGQINLLALLFLMVGYYLYSKKKLVESGMTIALALLAKPVLCFILIFFIAKNAWKLIFVLSGTLIFLLFMSFMLFGYEMELFYLQQIVPELLKGDTGRDIYYNQGFLGFFSRQIDVVPLRNFLTYGISLGLLIYTLYKIHVQKLDDNRIFSLLLTLLPLTHTLSWQHHFVFLIFPYIFATNVILKYKKNYFIFLLTFSYLLISLNIKNPEIFINSQFILLLSHTFFGGLILLVLLLATSGMVNLKSNVKYK